MATPAQTQVTLDASQFIAAVDQIGISIADMNKNLASANTAFASFSSSATNMESHLQKIALNTEGTVNGLNALFNATKQNTNALTQMNTALTQIAISTRAAAQSLDQMGQSTTKVGQAAAQTGRSFTFAFDGILRLLTVTTVRRIFLDIAASMQAAVSGAAEFTEKVGLILAVNQNLGTSVEGLSRTFANLSIAFNRPVSEVANAGFQAVQSGAAQTAPQVEQVTSAVGRLAEITGTTMPQAMTATTAVLRAFKLDASEAQNVTNQLFHIMQSGIGVNEIGSSIGRVSAQAQRLGISFSELGLFMETIKATGVSDAEVMTQVAAVMNSLERPTTRLQALLGEHGLFNPQQLIQAQRLHGALQLINQDMSEGNITARQAVQSRRAGGGLSVVEEFSQRSQSNPLNNISALQGNSDAALRMVNSTQQWNSELQKIKTIFESEIAPAIIKSILNISEKYGGFGTAITDTGRLLSGLAGIVIRVVDGYVILGTALERILELSGLVNENTRINADVMRRFATSARQGSEALSTWVSTQKQATNESLQRGSQNIANAFAPVNRELNRESELQRERVHNLSELIDASSKSVFSGFAAQIDAMESAARHAESRISESLKRVGEFADKTDKDAFEHRLKSAGDVTQVSRFSNSAQEENASNLLFAQNGATTNQINLVRQRRQRLNEEIQRLQDIGDTVSMAAARRRFEQLRQLSDQEIDLQVQRNRRIAEFNARSSGGNQTFNPLDREREQLARNNDTAEAAFEANARERDARRQVALERINNQLRIQLRLVQDGQRDIGRLPARLLTPEGLPRQSFQGAAGGQSAQTLISGTINDQIARVRALPETIENGIRTALSQGLISNVEAQQARNRAPSPQELLGLVSQLEQQKIATQQLFANAEARRVSEANQRAEIALLETIASNTNKATDRVAEVRQEQQTLLQQAQERINAIRTQVPRAPIFGGENATPEGRITQALRQAIIDADRTVRRAATTGGQDDVQKAEEAIRLVRDLSTTLTREFPRNVINTTPLENTLTRLITTLEQRPIREAELLVHQQSTPRGEGPNEGTGEGFASGGLIGNAFSSFGPDNTMINARKGEFVVNPDSTRKFYATLVAINRGDNPRGGGYAHGGTVSSNIGTMNFNVSGAENPHQTAHAVMKIIRREQRRGNV